MRQWIRCEFYGAVVGAILSVTPTADAGWFNFRGDSDEPKQSLILGGNGSKLDSVAVPPPVVRPLVTPATPYLSDSPPSMAPPAPITSMPMIRPAPAFDPDACETTATLAPPNEFDSFCAMPLWSVRAGALFLHRSRAAGDTLFNYGATLAPVSANSLGLGTAAGYDFGLTRQLTDCYDIDFRFFGLSGWRAAAAYPADTVTTTALGFPAGPANIPVTLNYGLNLFSNEVNVRRWFNDSWALTGGARWFETSESFVFGIPGTGNFATTNTSNHLYGAQMGLVWRKNFERLSFQANGNAGLYGNYASLFASSPLHADAARYTRGHTAFASDLVFLGSYRFTNHLAVRAGYQLLWIDSVALAPNQVNAVNVPARTGAIDFGHTFYHGALVGFDITW